jgi:hypothetical protein
MRGDLSRRWRENRVGGLRHRRKINTPANAYDGRTIAARK